MSDKLVLDFLEDPMKNVCSLALALLPLTLAVACDKKAEAPAETTPAETTPAETTPAETTPAETTPAEATPAETKPAEAK